MLQRQKDMLQSGQEIQRPQTLIGQDSLEKMGKELVRLCDAVERHGLVDYQYGVWEEEIVSSKSAVYGLDGKKKKKKKDCFR